MDPWEYRCGVERSVEIATFPYHVGEEAELEYRSGEFAAELRFVESCFLRSDLHKLSSAVIHGSRDFFEKLGSAVAAQRRVGRRCGERFPGQGVYLGGGGGFGDGRKGFSGTGVGSCDDCHEEAFPFATLKPYSHQSG